MQTERQQEAISPTVAEMSKRGEEIRARWAWTEPAVWTDAMLAALENGVKGGRWYSLIDKVWKEGNLEAAWARVRANKGVCGVDGQTVHVFEKNAPKELEHLRTLLQRGTYAPTAVMRTYILKPGSREKRPLGIPVVRDRVVQTATRQVMEPIFEQGFAEHSYGFRPGRGCRDALRVVNAALKEGRRWVVDADLKSYFDMIPHEKLMALVERRIADTKVLDLIRKYLKQGVMDGMKEWTPDEGTPQGSSISPLLANIYLDPLDHLMAVKGMLMVRYADDFIVLCRTQEDAQAALEVIKAWVAEAQLTLHPDKTRIVHEAEGFDFLGYTFREGMCFPRKKSLNKFKDKVREYTRRANGKSMEEIVVKLNASLRGWYGYFKHSYRTTFSGLDKWVRHRLRAILLKRQGKSRWRFTHEDHKTWPNAYFYDLGLFSLAKAHESECRSRKRNSQLESRMREIRQSGSEGGVAFA
ncbi:MAG: group II intron reverse transcriptase/maturase [Chlorobium sp.]